MPPRGGRQATEPARHALAVPDFLTLTATRTNAAKCTCEDQRRSVRNPTPIPPPHDAPLAISTSCHIQASACVWPAQLCASQGCRSPPVAGILGPWRQSPRRDAPDYTVGEAGTALAACRRRGATFPGAHVPGTWHGGVSLQPQLKSRAPHTHAHNNSSDSPIVFI